MLQRCTYLQCPCVCLSGNMTLLMGKSGIFTKAANKLLIQKQFSMLEILVQECKLSVGVMAVKSEQPGQQAKSHKKTCLIYLHISRQSWSWINKGFYIAEVGILVSNILYFVNWIHPMASKAVIRNASSAMRQVECYWYIVNWKCYPL